MKKFCVALIVIFSFLVTPVFANACEVKDSATHQTSDSKKSHDSDSKMKKCADCCHQHSQADRFIPKEVFLELIAVKSTFTVSHYARFPSIITSPLLEPPSA